MRLFILRFFLFLVLLPIFKNEISAQDASDIHNTYRNSCSSFSEITKYLSTVQILVDEDDDMDKLHVFRPTNGYLLVVKKTNQKRAISEFKLNFLIENLRSLGISENLETLFQNEVLIQAGSENFWLPIQESLLPHWDKELKYGDYVSINIRTIGAIEDTPENKWVFTINGFNSFFSDELWNESLKSFESGKEKNGLKCLNKLISLFPKDGRNFAMLGYYYYDKGFPDNLNLFKKADSLFSISEQLTPDYSYQYYQRALLKYQLEDYEQSWILIDKARLLGEINIEKEFLDELEAKLPYAVFKKD